MSNSYSFLRTSVFALFALAGCAQSKPPQIVSPQSASSAAQPTPLALTSQFTSVVTQLNLGAVPQTAMTDDMHRLGVNIFQADTLSDPANLAVLKAIGAISGEINQSKLSESQYQQLSQYQHSIANITPWDLGDLNDNRLQMAFIQHWAFTIPEWPDSAIETLNQLIRSHVISGYNLQPKNTYADFEPAQTLLYGHSDPVHAQQLLALLQLKGIQARVRLKPKQSAFEVRDGWQDSSEGDRIQDNTEIRYSKEYDLVFEFNQRQMQDAFLPLIQQYAKKDQENQTGLIDHSWWQPFIRGLAPAPALQQVQAILIDFNEFEAVILVNPAKVDATISAIQAQLPNQTLSKRQLWVNPAFYRYLYGDFK